MTLDVTRAEWVERITFLGAFVLGVVTILVSGRSGTAIPVVALVALLVIMAGYAFLAHRGRSSHWGDRCYYMGFLFTLVSMMTALHRYTVDESLEVVIPTFSLALGTTVAGLVLRVIADQQEMEEEDVGGGVGVFGAGLQERVQRVGMALDGLAERIHGVQEDVGSGAAQLARDVGAAGKDLRGLAKDVRAKWIEVGASFARPAKDLKDFGADVSRLTGELRKLAEAQREVLGNSQAMQQAWAKQLAQQKAVDEDYRATVNGMRDVVGDMGRTVEEISQATTAAREGLVKATRDVQIRVHELQQVAHSWTEVVSGMAEVGTKQVGLMGQMRESVKETGSGVERLRGGVGVLDASVSRLVDAAETFEGHVEGLRNACGQMGAASDRMETLVRDLPKLAEDAKAAHTKGAAVFRREVGRSLDTASRVIGRAVGDASGEVAARTSELDAVAGSWEQVVTRMAAVGNAQAGLMQEVQGSVGVVGGVVEELQRGIAGLGESVGRLHGVATTFGGHVEGLQQAGRHTGAAGDRMAALVKQVKGLADAVEAGHTKGAAVLRKEVDESLELVSATIRRAVRDASKDAGRRVRNSGRRRGWLGRLFRR